MKFSVIFSASARSGNSVELPNKSIGTKGVSKIRERLGEAVPLDRIECVVSALNCNVVIPVEEEAAKEISHFDHHNTVYIATKPGELNEFVREFISTDWDDVTNEILKTRLKRVIGIKEIFSAWIFKGSPASW